MKLSNLRLWNNELRPSAVQANRDNWIFDDMDWWEFASPESDFCVVGSELARTRVRAVRCQDGSPRQNGSNCLAGIR